MHCINCGQFVRVERYENGFCGSQCEVIYCADLDDQDDDLDEEYDEFGDEDDDIDDDEEFDDEDVLAEN